MHRSRQRRQGRLQKWQRRFSRVTLWLAVGIILLGLPVIQLNHIPPGNEFEFGYDLLALAISAGAFLVSATGLIVTTILSVRNDRRAALTNKRAQEEHEWKKADRARPACAPCAPEGDA